ncbi:hypothetical protein GGP66_003174 [Salinibacter ruber]|jgi:hypothetical protein|uniref:Uncharacterized protein n=1 Tax=Salinibacter ruber TaxID=146919 RepID=A0A9X2UNG6_9BACT|nr:hypothetical protein [Salinibacter ruber]MCS3613125.1 hypothetical protein [Salinibacter ruber]MCS3616682.1 hypothetical protein [Salinibacter ruber]MCS3648474.1 hypothetical protein [Salinibacter ruber]MCS3675727.1 hypothetical protein [Salinibacter ruber]
MYQPHLVFLLGFLFGACMPALGPFPAEVQDRTPVRSGQTSSARIVDVTDGDTFAARQ